MLTCFTTGCFSYSFALFLPLSEDVQGNHVPPGNLFLKPLHKNTTGKLLSLLTLLHRTVNMLCMLLQPLPVARCLMTHIHMAFSLCTPKNCCHTHLHNHHSNLDLFETVLAQHKDAALTRQGCLKFL